MSRETYAPWDVAEVLIDEETIIEYLKAALEENDPEFFVKAVGNAARAMGMTAVARESQLGRASLYKALSGERDPRIGTVMKVLDALGIRLSVEMGARAASVACLQSLTDDFKQAVLAWRVFCKLELVEADATIPAHQGVLNEYKGFFSPVRTALLDSLIMAVMRILDRDSKTMSIYGLQQRVKSIPNLLDGDYKSIPNLLDGLDKVGHVVEEIKELRNKHIAHSDPHHGPIPQLIVGEIEGLLDALRGTLDKADNFLKQPRSPYPTAEADKATAALLRVLGEPIEKYRSENKRNVG